MSTRMDATHTLIILFCNHWPVLKSYFSSVFSTTHCTIQYEGEGADQVLQKAVQLSSKEILVWPVWFSVSTSNLKITHQRPPAITKWDYVGDVHIHAKNGGHWGHCPRQFFGFAAKFRDFIRIFLDFPPNLGILKDF